MDPRDPAGAGDGARARRYRQSQRTDAARHGLVLASAAGALGATVAIGLTIPAHGSAGTGSSSTHQSRQEPDDGGAPVVGGHAGGGTGDDGSRQQQQRQQQPAPQQGGLAGTGSSGPAHGQSSGS